ncbi:hypothetical protein ACS5NO_03750 [Larkinella sp. GY13]|uniref:hypothetical protein n=1 Tax=Larkinella sp. GY13 TaxID=3453720 RepID=UPI003EEAA123
MKQLVSFFIILMALPTLAQTTAPGQASWNGNNSALRYVKRFQERGVSEALKNFTAPELDDTLRAKRHLFATTVYQNGAKLSNSAISQLLESVPKARKRFQFGNVLKPIGPVVAVSGLVIGYIGIKGNPATSMVRGIRTPTNPNVADVQVAYTKRSLPKVLGGLGLFVGGLCLIEVSNELTAASVNLYNSRNKAISHLNSIKLGISNNGDICLKAKF